MLLLYKLYIPLQIDFQEEVNNAISPFLYVHNFYSNMVDTVQVHFSMTWSFFIATEDGTMIVMRSPPHYVANSQETETYDGQ